MFLTACQKRSHSECHVVCTPKRKTWGANLKGLTPRSVNGAFPASAGTRGTLVHMGQIIYSPFMALIIGGGQIPDLYALLLVSRRWSRVV